eukprot:TRINITY_DN6785_c0_g1_i2.p1 TRINITY_DN6785_c0_g1~~TRINITY_DN6785_c0_g1_i2.p1  ORF type:complete len:311 (-),score=72.90 TRINITY_DN6785_c0_g1_i2:264-1097(-)
MCIRDRPQDPDRVRKRRRFEDAPPEPPQADLLGAAVARALAAVGGGDKWADACEDVQINDCINRAEMIHGSLHRQVYERTGASVVVRGRYHAAQQANPGGEPPLHLHVKAKGAEALAAAVHMLHEVRRTGGLVREAVAVGMSVEDGFDVVAKLRGPAEGGYLQHIAAQTGCTVLLTGACSEQGGAEALAVEISFPAGEAAAGLQARQLVDSLLATVRAERTEWSGEGDAGAAVVGRGGAGSVEDVPAEIRALYSGIIPPLNGLVRQTSAALAAAAGS